MAPAAASVGEAAVFAAPTAGVPAAQRWLQQGVLAADHVAAGAFDSAMRLLNRRAAPQIVDLHLGFCTPCQEVRSARGRSCGCRRI